MAASIVSRSLNHFVRVSGASTLQVAKPALCGVLCVNQQSARSTTTKHYDPKFKKLRAAKVFKVELPNFEEERLKGELTPEQMRAKMKEKGIAPPRPWNERPMSIHSTGGVFEPYVPPEGDGKVSSVSMQGAKQKLEFLGKKSKSMMSLRKIRNFDEDFNLNAFALEAQEIYIAAHEAMVSQDKDKIISYVTERAYPEIQHNMERKTVRWKFFGSIEPPKVVHVRTTDVITKENIFAQITVRLHTQQSLSIYDRFGRLEHGSDDSVRDVLEYIVFEKHVANQYGRWRVHDKIIPDWLPEKEPSRHTFIVTPEEPELEETEKENTEEKAAESPGNLAVA